MFFCVLFCFSLHVLTFPSIRGMTTGMSDGWPRMLSADSAALRSPASPRLISTAIFFTKRLGQVSLRALSLVMFKYCDGKRVSADNRSMQATRKKEARETMAVCRRSGSRRTTFESSNDFGRQKIKKMK